MLLNNTSYQKITHTNSEMFLKKEPLFNPFSIFISIIITIALQTAGVLSFVTIFPVFPSASLYISLPLIISSYLITAFTIKILYNHLITPKTISFNTAANIEEAENASNSQNIPFSKIQTAFKPSISNVKIKLVIATLSLIIGQVGLQSSLILLIIIPNYIYKLIFSLITAITSMLLLTINQCCLKENLIIIPENNNR